MAQAEVDYTIRSTSGVVFVTDPSAVHKALHNSVILCEVFAWIPYDLIMSCRRCNATNIAPTFSLHHSTLSLENPDNAPCFVHAVTSFTRRCSRKPLLSLALVDQFWFHEAIRILWRRAYADENITETTLTLHFLRMRPERRQLYADVIRSAVEITYNRNLVPSQTHGSDVHSATSSNMACSVFDGITFHNLRKLWLLLCSDFAIPRIICPNLKILILERGPQARPYSHQGPREHRNLLANHLIQVAEIFPHVERVGFASITKAYPGTMQWFARRMPQLKILDRSMVEETNDEQLWSC